MKIIDTILTVLVTMATLLQGADAGLNLWNRWKSSKRSKETQADETRGIRSPISIRLTRCNVGTLMFAIPWYSFIIAEIAPAYRYFSVLPRYDRILTMVLYFFFLAVYPRMIKKTSRKWLLWLTTLFPCIDFTLANLIFFAPHLLRAEWYPFVFATVHSISFTGFKFCYMSHFIQEIFIPWVDSLPKK